MSGLIVSRAELKDRLGSRAFWRRAAMSLLAGYVYAALGFSVALSLFGTVVNTVRYPPENVFWGIAGFLLTVPHLVITSFLFFLVLAALPMLMMQPVAVVSALTLRTGRTATLIFGTAIGAIVGTPIALERLPQNLDDLATAISCAGAGAMFALAVWQMCLKHYVPHHPPVKPGRFAAWWRSLNLPMKFGLTLGCVALAVFFL